MRAKQLAGGSFIECSSELQIVASEHAEAMHAESRAPESLACDGYIASARRDDSRRDRRGKRAGTASGDTERSRCCAGSAYHRTFHPFVDVALFPAICV